MKNLIAVFTYCPDTERKLILTQFLNQIQCAREKNDIIVVSHSELPEIVKDLSDYQYIESNNHIITDYEFNNKFWFSCDAFFAHSSLVYPFSTHMSIYSLIHYIINFSRFKKYEKIHCIEYDINIEDVDIITQVNDKLENYDNIMFKSQDGWIHGVYFAFKTKNFPDEYFEFDKDYILSNLKTIDSRMTEHYTPFFLSVNQRTTYFETTEIINKEGKLQNKDSHGNENLNWCVPIIEKDTDNLYFFVYNEKGGEHKIEILFNDRHVTVSITEHGAWKLVPIGKLSESKKIMIILNDKIKHNLKLSEETELKFKENNFFYWK